MSQSVKKNKRIQAIVGYVLSAIGAVGVAFQNYVAVEMFIRGAVLVVAPISTGLSRVIRVLSIGFGGVGSGMVNFFINMDLLEAFFKRFTSEGVSPSLAGWVKFQYIAGIMVFVTTGLLFGLTAFTFAITTPFAVLAVSTGLFVAIIMTIQELETWLQSFDDQPAEATEFSVGKLCGHIIAAGNVIGLSLLFTLGLMETLMIFHVAAFPALIAGLCVAFTGGAFTEFYFYNFFLAKFCHTFDAKWQLMINSKQAAFGLFCVISNALVNLALTYSGVGLLAGVLVTAGIALPPVGVIIGLSALSGLFAGAASFLLGMDFWIRNMSSPAPQASATAAMSRTETETPTTPSILSSSTPSPSLGFFQSSKPVSSNDEDVVEVAQTMSL